MDKLLTGITAYDPSEVSVTLAGMEPSGFAFDTKIILKSVTNILAEFHLHVNSESCQRLMKYVGETVDYEVGYNTTDNNGSWQKGLSQFLHNNGAGKGRLEYELALGAEFPVVKFYIIEE